MKSFIFAILLILGSVAHPATPEPDLVVDKGTTFTINLGNELQINTWVYDLPKNSPTCTTSGRCFKSKVSFVNKGIQEHAEYFDFKAVERGIEYLHFSLRDSEHKVVSESIFMVVIK